MKHYKLVHETPAHYVIHDLRDKQNFHIAKKGIDKNTSDTIKSLSPMNADSASNYNNDMPDNRNIPGTDSRTVGQQPQHYAEGGDVTSSDSTDSKKDTSTDSKKDTSTDTKTTEDVLPSDPYVTSYTHPAAAAPQTNFIPHFDDGGEVKESGEQVIGKMAAGFATPTPAPATDPDADREARYAKIREDNAANFGRAHGGKVPKFAAGTMEGTVQDAINAEQPATDAALATAPQANPNLPADFDQQVKQEQLRLATTAGLPVTTTGENPTGVDLEQFRSKAETNIAAQHQAGQAQLEQVAKDTYAAQVDQTNADNAIRAKSGLAPLDVPPPPSFPGAPTMPSKPGTTIPLDQQISFAPKSSQAGMGIPMDNVGKQYAAGIKQETAGIQAGANAQSEGSRQAAEAMQDYLDNQQAQQKIFEQENEASKRHLDILEQAATTGKIDPNRYWNSQSTGSKIAAAIGLFFGGIGSGLTGQPNAALEIMQNAIKRDIEAQMADKSNEMSLYKIGLEKYRDSRSAQQFATLQANALLQGQLAKVAQSTGSAQAQANAQQMIGALKAQSAPIKQKLDLESMQMRMLNQPDTPQTGSGVNVDKLRTMVNLGFIKPELAPKVMDEYGQYNQLRDILNHTDDVFKQTTENANYTERALPGWTPTLRESSKKYEAVANAWLGNITKETEGRVTPQDVKLMETSLPRAGDSPEVIQTKLNSIKDMIRNKYKFSELPANHLISTNDPVITPSSTRNKRFTPGAPTTGQ